MKWSQGMTQWPATVALFACFIVGAGLNALAMTRGELGVTYVVIIGLEALMAVAFGMYFFEESLTASRMLAITLAMVCIGLLR